MSFCMEIGWSEMCKAKANEDEKTRRDAGTRTTISWVQDDEDTHLPLPALAVELGADPPALGSMSW